MIEHVTLVIVLSRKKKNMNKLILGNNIDEMKNIPSNTFDSVVTDPPYGINFMNKKWDKVDSNFHYNWAKEVLRVTKPGGYMLVFSSPRTFHRMAVDVENAGWEVKDCLMWLYGEGFPKSLNIAKAIDSFYNEEGEYGDYKTKDHAYLRKNGNETLHEGYHRPWRDDEEAVEKNKRKYIPATEEAKKWNGWHTALKPAWEPIFLFRKSLSEKSIVENVLKHGVGAMNIEDCRIPTENSEKTGRWPANLILDDDPFIVDNLPKNKSKSSLRNNKVSNFKFYDDKDKKNVVSAGFDDEGSVTRFFYCPKSRPGEKEYGLDDFEFSIVDDGRDKKIDNPYLRGKTQRKNIHPTVKPVKLLTHLVRMITPEGGTVFDPFMGSGSTGIACVIENKDFYGIEIEKDYFDIAKARIEYVS